MAIPVILLKGALVSLFSSAAKKALPSVYEATGDLVKKFVRRAAQTAENTMDALFDRFNGLVDRKLRPQEVPVEARRPPPYRL